MREYVRTSTSTTGTATSLVRAITFIPARAYYKALFSS